MKTKCKGALVCFFAGLLALMGVTARAEQLDRSQYAHTFEMSVSGYTGASELTDFPVLVDLLAVTGLSTDKLGNLTFVDDAGNILPHEFDSASDSEPHVWVKVPRLTAGTKLYAYYGGTADPQDSNPSAVWSRYAAVYHFSSDTDSTGHGLTVKYGYSKDATQRTDSPLGLCYRIAAGTQKIVLGKPTDYLTDGKLQSISLLYRNTYSSAATVKGRMVCAKKTHSEDGKGGFDVLPQMGYVYMRGANYTNGGTFISEETPFTPDTWKHVVYVFNDKNAACYVDGVALKSKSQTGTTINPADKAVAYDVCLGNMAGDIVSDDQCIKGDYDEVRFFDGVMTADWAGAEYATAMNKASFLTYSEQKNVDSSLPVIRDVTVKRVGTSDTYEVTAKVEGTGTYTAQLICTSTAGDTREVDATIVDGVFTATTPADLADGTWSLALRIQVGEAVVEASVVRIVKGGVSIELVRDANEYELQAGAFKISRPDAAPTALVVMYTVASDLAVADQTYQALSGTALIPAGETSVEIPVVPLSDANVKEDAVLKIAIAPNDTFMAHPSAEVIDLTILNIAYQEGVVTWIATGSDGLASNPANWSTDAVPGENDNVLIDGNFSKARCNWDAAGPQRVKSLTIKNNPPTVELQTTFEGLGFPVLTITDDLEFLSGVMTGSKNETATKTYRLSLNVGGNVTIAAGAQVKQTGKGYPSGTKPAGSECGLHGGTMTAWTQAYDSVYEPNDLGAGGSTVNCTGGGALWLECAGTITVNGEIESSASFGNTTPNIGLGAGGSIYIKARDLQGAGTISVQGHKLEPYITRWGGGGGRLAIVLTEATELAFPKSHLNANGLISQYNTTGAAGTIFVKTANQAHGTLIVGDVLLDNHSSQQFYHTKMGVTAIPPNTTWEFDAIEFRDAGVLAVPEGTTLRVPLSGVTGTSRFAGLLYAGGTLDLGPAPYNLKGEWVFIADTPYTFEGDVNVSEGAGIGAVRFAGTFDNYVKCDVTVNGNLTVAEDGYLWADNAGMAATNNDEYKSAHGGQTAQLTANATYDSVFEPFLPGQVTTPTHATESESGGVIKLAVNGNLVLDGLATARGPLTRIGGGSGGTINIRAKTLSGTGSISVAGQQGRKGDFQWNNAYHGAPGRVAIRVTDEDVGTEGVWSKITARGVLKLPIPPEYSDTFMARNVECSAGTVYLQGKSDGEGGGTIYVSNKGLASAITDVPTYIPSGDTHGVEDNYENARLVVGEKAIVRLDQAYLKMRELVVEDTGALDLFGKHLVVRKALINGVKLNPGTYTAAYFGDALVDNAEEGSDAGVLQVVGTGLRLIIR